MEIIQIIGVGFAGILIAGILKEYKPEFKIYVSIVVGIIIFFIASDKLAIFINLSILTEFAVSICKDSGENAIASKIDLGGKIIILSFSIPIISALLETLLNLL